MDKAYLSSDGTAIDKLNIKAVKQSEHDLTNGKGGTNNPVIDTIN